MSIILCICFLFFAVYVIYKKNGSFSRVLSLFFQTKVANSFFQKKMPAVGVGQQGAQAVGSSHCQKFLRFIPNIFPYPKLVKH